MPVFPAITVLCEAKEGPTLVTVHTWLWDIRLGWPHSQSNGQIVSGIWLVSFFLQTWQGPLVEL